MLKLESVWLHGSLLWNHSTLQLMFFCLISYAAANRWDDATYARKMMKKKNVKKDPGFSWIEVKNKLHLFVVDDRSHPPS